MARSWIENNNFVVKTRSQSLEDAMAYIFLPYHWYCAIANISTQPLENSDNQAYSARKCQAGVFFSWVCSHLPIVDPHSESPGHMYSFAKYDQRVESVKHRWVCCWLLFANCCLLVAGLLVPRAHCPLLSWVISSQGNGCGPWERWRWGRAQSSAGASFPVPYRDTSSRVVQVVLLVHHPAASCVRLNRVYNWVRAKVTDGGGWVWQAQENMSLFSLKHPRVADHAHWWDICHWIFVLIK